MTGRFPTPGFNCLTNVLTMLPFAKLLSNIYWSHWEEKLYIKSGSWVQRPRSISILGQHQYLPIATLCRWDAGYSFGPIILCKLALWPLGMHTSQNICCCERIQTYCRCIAVWQHRRNQIFLCEVVGQKLNSNSSWENNFDRQTDRHTKQKNPLYELYPIVDQAYFLALQLIKK